ncbi:hypothetical protein HMI55_001202, partial [Coelomomyces lativittatus]
TYIHKAHILSGHPSSNMYEYAWVRAHEMKSYLPSSEYQDLQPLIGPIPTVVEQESSEVH